MKVAREQAGLTQDELAAEARTTRRTIGAIENGRTTAQEGVLARILAVLDLGPEDVLVDDEIEAWLSTLAPLLQRLSPAERARLMPVIVEYVAEALERQKRLG